MLDTQVSDQGAVTGVIEMRNQIQSVADFDAGPGTQIEELWKSSVSSARAVEVLDVTHLRACRVRKTKYKGGVQNKTEKGPIQQVGVAEELGSNKPRPT